MSALAHYFHQQGKKVSGYDRAVSRVTRELEKEGIEIFYKMDEAHLNEQDLMVYTPAISRNSIEYTAAEERGIPIMKRSQVLGEISRSYKTLAVAGTHGKTTTSTMLTHVLRECGVDCTAFLGGISNNLDSNFVIGNSDLLVVEADEYDRSFMTLNPDMAVITSMDADHLDIYGTLGQMREDYLAFAAQCDKILVADGWEEAFAARECETFGIGTGKYYADNLHFSDLKTGFDYVSPEGRIRDLSLPMPGRHNVMNMVAAISVAIRHGADVEKVRQAVASFRGIYRRFDVHIDRESCTYIDDYAHHPSEIAAVVQTARDLFPERKLIVVFQPHLFSRTRDFMKGFAEELSKADAVMLMDIYPAREEPIEGVSSGVLLDQISINQKQLTGRNELPAQLKEWAKGRQTVVMTLGAGDIDREVEAIKNELSKI